MQYPDAFNYIEQLQLVIVAIGVAKILVGLSWLLENRNVCGTYWVHTLGAVLVGLLQLQYAWTSFFDYSVVRWSFGDFLLECSTPMIYLFVSNLLFPDSLPERCNLTKTYRTHIPLIAGLAIASQVANSILDFRFHPGEAHHVLQHVIRGAVIVVLCGFFLPFPRFKRIHEIVIVLLIVAFIIFCLFLTPSIQVHP